MVTPPQIQAPTFTRGLAGDAAVVRSLAARHPVVAATGACLTTTVVLSSAAAGLNASAIALLAVLALGGLGVALRTPIVLLYAYAAAIPFNFALPPGPAGTVARVAGVVFFVGYLIREPNTLRPSSIPWPGWLFVGWALASSLWAMDTGLAFETWLSLAQLFAISVLVASVVAGGSTVARNALWSYAGSASVTAAAGVVAYVQGAGMFSRATAFSGQDPALFASILLPATLFLIAEAATPTVRAPHRVLAGGGLVVCVAALALSGTRSAWIGLLVATMAWLIIERGRPRLLPLAALGFCAACLIVAVPGAGDFLLARLGTSVSTGGSGRTDIWTVGIGILASAPLLGVGLGGFGVAFTPYAISHAPLSTVGAALSPDMAAHNVLLGTTVETGLVGGALLLAFGFAAVAHPGNDRVTNVVRAALIGLFAQAMFLDILLQKQPWLLLALAFGLAAARRPSPAAAAVAASAMSDAPPRPRAP